MTVHDRTRLIGSLRLFLIQKLTPCKHLLYVNSIHGRILGAAMKDLHQDRVTRFANPFAYSNLTPLFFGLLLTLFKKTEATQISENGPLGCLYKTSSIPIPSFNTSCAVTYTYDFSQKNWIPGVDGCSTLICPTPTKKPTKHPVRRTAKPTRKKASGPTPQRTQNPTPEPTPEPTVKKTKHPTPQPHPTKRPTKKTTKPPTICMAAEAIPNEHLTDLLAQNQDAGNNKGRRRLTTAVGNTLPYSSGIFSRGVGYISFNVNNILQKCIATLISSNIVTFPADCMFRDYKDEFGSIIRDIPQEWYASVMFHGGLGNDNYSALTAKYLLGFYADAYKNVDANAAEFNVALMVIDPPLGLDTGWMNVATNTYGTSMANQLRYTDPAKNTAVIDSCCTLKSTATSLYNNNCGPNNTGANGAPLYAQVVTDKQKVIDYQLKAMNTRGASGYNVGVGASVIKAMQQYVEENTDFSSSYSGAGLARAVDKAISCKNTPG
jgi:hypothetical protein